GVQTCALPVFQLTGRRVNVTMTLTLLAAVAVSVVLSLAIIRMITGPLMVLAEAARGVAAGNLARSAWEDQASWKDEIGQLYDAFRDTVRSLRQVVGEVIRSEGRRGGRGRRRGRARPGATRNGGAECLA